MDAPDRACDRCRKMSAPTRMLLADDHELVRSGVRRMLERVPDLRVVAEASDGAQAVELALKADLDLALLDVSMPKVTGIDAAREILAHRPNTRVLMLSMHENDAFVHEVLHAGASGYILKSAAERELVEACRAAMRGEQFLYPGAVAALIRDYRKRLRDGAADTGEPLTPRERGVVKLIAEEHSTPEIARILMISANTVERHRANVSSKLGFRDRVALTRYAIRRGLIEP